MYHIYIYIYIYVLCFKIIAFATCYNFLHVIIACYFDFFLCWQFNRMQNRLSLIIWVIFQVLRRQCKPLFDIFLLQTCHISWEKLVCIFLIGN